MSSSENDEKKAEDLAFVNEENRVETEDVEEGDGPMEQDGGEPVGNGDEDEGEPELDIITYVIGPFYFDSAVWVDEREGAKYIAMPAMSITQATTKIRSMLKSKVPANFIVLVYQAYVENTDLTTIESNLSDLVQSAMRNDHHKLVITSCWFVPVHERNWEKVNALNAHIRLLNLDMGMQPLSLQKALLCNNPNGKIQYIRPKMFAEYVNRIGLGESLSVEGMEKIREYILKYIEGGAFEDTEKPASKAVVPDSIPPALCFSNGYKGDAVMMEFIKDKGLRTPVRTSSLPRSRAEAGTSGAGPSDSRSVSAKRPANPNKRIHEPRFRERATANAISRRNLKFGQPEKTNKEPITWNEEDDLTEEEKLTKIYLEAKKKLEIKKGPTAEDLTKQLKTMRLEGIKASKRSREKYEEFEADIRKLKEELKEKDRKLRKLNEKELKIEDLKDQLDEKYDDLKRLRRDLEHADSEAIEWKEAYDQLNEEKNGRKKRRSRRESS